MDAEEEPMIRVQLHDTVPILNSRCSVSVWIAYEKPPGSSAGCELCVVAFSAAGTVVSIRSSEKAVDDVSCTWTARNELTLHLSQLPDTVCTLVFAAQAAKGSVLFNPRSISTISFIANIRSEEKPRQFHPPRPAVSALFAGVVLDRRSTPGRWTLSFLNESCSYSGPDGAFLGQLRGALKMAGEGGDAMPVPMTATAPPVAHPSLGNKTVANSEGQFPNKCNQQVAAGLTVISPIAEQVLRVGCGWDPPAAGNAVDVDLSCLLFDADGHLQDMVYWGKHTASVGGVYHSGDNQSGDADGDDESICVDLTRLAHTVTHIGIVLTVNEGTQRFGDAKNLNLRLRGKTQTYMQLSHLNEKYPNESCLVAAVLVRDGTRRAECYVHWVVVPHCTSVTDTTVRDAVSALVRPSAAPLRRSVVPHYFYHAPAQGGGGPTVVPQGDGAARQTTNTSPASVPSFISSWKVIVPLVAVIAAMIAMAL